MAAREGDLDESQESVSMVEVLEEEAQREEDANAVLGGSDDKHCTYPQGYMPRQALYSCNTCTPSDGQPAGVCLACCLECHEGHDLYELYTKRNFCCDCGNSKFSDKKCKLYPERNATNSENQYNQNFRGVYCTCHRPYPDPDDQVEDDMIQCVLCEDWYHGRHLKSKVPDGNEFEEMTCYLCLQKYPYLSYYKHLQVLSSQGTVIKVKVAAEGQSKDIDVCSEAEKTTDGGEADDSAKLKNSHENGEGIESKEIENVSTSSKEDGKVEESLVNTTPEKIVDNPKVLTENGKTDSSEQDTDASKSTETPGCRLQSLKENSVQDGNISSAYWSKGWRKDLCQCTACVALYREGNIPFITDESDTITVYEARGRHGQGQSGSQYEQGMEALSQMDRVQQVEMIHGFNSLKTELKDYLKKFADNGKVVKEEDIREFFTALKGRKRQKTEMAYHCK